MSDALDYLVQARPDAVGHYFAFLKACGTHLDPKTRNLISVITKVHAQTERGFRQYLKRALREGCTPMEVLDALLMAFPTLGLARIVWAVDLILAMELPGFDIEALKAAQAPAEGPSTAVGTVGATEPSWHDLLATRGFKIGETRRVEADGRGLFVHRGARDDWRVFDSLCPHQSTDIPHLALQGHTLACPKHGWTFDIRSGQCTGKGKAPLRQWQWKVQGGRLWAQW
ncbi:MAG TPA: Rieske 2Fe-2S domain-containing protein [Burkholderiaceae bacterium]|nr:Rieske 2Fe-2S domain-containing protein [Burkholderiaceae bacterium]HNB47091.1 Rieske 2Fe-2S domain-containing protein [Burkholderiaceae bacterium]HNG82548.1 Rieske 2Fe-2S domain-containing protein [Burkholderiaceae bacterium]